MNFYVDGAVQSSRNGTSWQAAWNSFAAIDWTIVHPGDTIYVSGGAVSQTYAETLNVRASGTAAAPITVTPGVDAGHSGQVIIDGRGSLRNGITIWNRDNVVVSGFWIRNIADAGISVDGAMAGVVVQNNNVYSGDPGGGNARGYDVRDSTGPNAVVVRNNKFDTPGSTLAQTDGIYSSNNDGVVFDGNTIVISNSDTAGHSDGFQSYLDKNVTITNNVFEQANSAAVDNHGAWMSDTQSGGTIVFSHNVVLAPNLTDDTAVTHWMEPGWTGTGTVEIAGNIIVGGKVAVNLDGSNGAVLAANIIEPAAGGQAYVVANAVVPPANISDNLVLAPTASGKFDVSDHNTTLSGSTDGQAYDGPVAFLQSQLIWSGAGGLAIRADTPNAFLHGGPGDDALQVTSGRNVLDGGQGSNFLVGATGADGGSDVFFLDDRASGVTWSTIVNFHAGDYTTVWGFDPARSVLTWADGQGTAGFTGATLHVQSHGKGTPIDGSLTFSGWRVADIKAALTISTGTVEGNQYLLMQS